MPTLTGARDTLIAQRQMVGTASPCACTTSMPSTARAMRRFAPMPALMRANDPLETIGIEAPMRMVR